MTIITIGDRQQGEGEREQTRTWIRTRTQTRTWSQNESQTSWQTSGKPKLAVRVSKVFNVDFKITFKSRTPIAHTHAHPLQSHTQSQVGSSITRLVAATESRHWPRPRRGYMNARTICMLYVCVCVCV